MKHDFYRADPSLIVEHFFITKHINYIIKTYMQRQKL